MNSENKEEKVHFGTIKKYFEDKATEEEIELVNQWLNRTDSSFKIESYLRLLWKETDPDIREPSINLDLLLDKIHHAINLKNRQGEGKKLPVGTKPVVTFTHALKIIARVAAILLLPIMGYLAWEIQIQKNWIKNQTEVTYNEIICPLGARSQFQLPDGTTGNLNNGSKLKYPVKFTGNTREVELIGEAYFDVVQNKKKPFIINTNGLDVKVLGTKLNVYSYPEEGYQEFTLESGTIELIKRENEEEILVARLRSGQHLLYNFERSEADIEHIQSDKKKVTLDNGEELDDFLNQMNPDQCAVYELKDGDLNIVLDETEYYTAWKDGKLILRNDPMPRLLKRIERWYNVKFNILDPSIKEYTYWATFEEENLEQVLNLLSLTGPIKFEKRPRVKMDDGTYKGQEIDVMIKE